MDRITHLERQLAQLRREADARPIVRRAQRPQRPAGLGRLKPVDVPPGDSCDPFDCIYRGAAHREIETPADNLTRFPLAYEVQLGSIRACCPALDSTHRLEYLSAAAGLITYGIDVECSGGTATGTATIRLVIGLTSEPEATCEHGGWYSRLTVTIPGVEPVVYVKCQQWCADCPNHMHLGCITPGGDYCSDRWSRAVCVKPIEELILENECCDDTDEHTAAPAYLVTISGVTGFYGSLLNGTWVLDFFAPDCSISGTPVTGVFYHSVEIPGLDNAPFWGNRLILYCISAPPVYADDFFWTLAVVDAEGCAGSLCFRYTSGNHACHAIRTFTWTSFVCTDFANHPATLTIEPLE